ncbi:hypothetical protein IU434_28885 [Nocardia farcinica]|nr:hypothetical protein [Nocardia farcinica]
MNVLARMLGHTDPSVTDMHFYQRKYINGSYPRSSVVTMAVAASGVAHNHSADTVGAARTGAGVGVVLATQVGHTRSVA